MKPIIIFKEKNKNGKFEFTESELKKLINDSYEEGYKDGKDSNPLTYPSYPPHLDPIYPIYKREYNNLGSNYRSCQECNWYKEMMANPGKIYVGDTPCTWCINNNPICTSSDFTNHTVNTNKSVDWKSYINSMNAQTPGLVENDKNVNR